MDASEKIRAIINYFLGMKERKLRWQFVTFRDIKYGTEIPKKESLPICELLKREGLIDYEFMPFDDPEMKNDIYNKYNDDIQDPTGSMSFFAFPKDDDDASLRRINPFETARLEEIVASKKELEALARKLKPEVRYNAEQHHLISGEQWRGVRSHNQRAVCEVIFAQPPGTVFLEREVAELLDEVTPRLTLDGEPVKGYRADYHKLYNILNQINLKIKTLTGVPHFITLETGQIWTG